MQKYLPDLAGILPDISVSLQDTEDYNISKRKRPALSRPSKLHRTSRIKNYALSFGVRT
jgi:hypothetical protein